MNRSIWAWVRLLGGVGILAVLLWRRESDMQAATLGDALPESAGDR